MDYYNTLYIVVSWSVATPWGFSYKVFSNRLKYYYKKVKATLETEGENNLFWLLNFLFYKVTLFSYSISCKQDTV